VSVIGRARSGLDREANIAISNHLGGHSDGGKWQTEYNIRKKLPIEVSRRPRPCLEIQINHRQFEKAQETGL
jgi:hypothetical protein